jgi:hypothetical protein
MRLIGVLPLLWASPPMRKVLDVNLYSKRVEKSVSTLETSGEDVKTTLETSEKDVKTTLETSWEDVKSHSKRVGKISFQLKSVIR